jgi:hypothetical protein
MPNYEQERILQLYGCSKYLEKRETLKRDSNFWTQPQERVITGVPVFNLVNDALQIHKAYRGERDRVLIIGIHIPHNLIMGGDLELIANTAIDLDYHNDARDYRITDFKKREGCMVIDYGALRVRGIDLHEMYIKGLPFDLDGHKLLGIEQKFFLSDIYSVDIKNPQFQNLGTDVLKNHEYFLHGLFGDQNVFGRGVTKYLPSRCYEVKKK